MSDTELDFDIDTDESGVEVEQVNDGDIPGTGDVEVELTEIDDASLAEAVAAASTEPVELTDEQKAEAEAKAKADAEAAELVATEKLDAFKAATEAVLANDERTDWVAELPVAVTEPVTSAYSELVGSKGKAAGKQYLVDRMQAKMIEGATNPASFTDARVYMLLNSALKDAKSKRETVAKPKVDPTTAFVERAAALMLAVNLLTVPSDVEEDWADKTEKLVNTLSTDVAAYHAWQAELVRVAKHNEANPPAEGEKPVEVETPDISAVVLAAAKIAAGRAVGSAGRKPSQSSKEGSAGSTSVPRVSTAGSGHRGDIAKHIREAMNTVGIGEFMSVADIAKVETSEYGTGEAPPPSQGAISARLFPRDGKACTLDFVRPEGPDQGQPKKGAVRTA
jgi:hypothetical protein